MTDIANSGSSAEETLLNCWKQWRDEDYSWANLNTVGDVAYSDLQEYWLTDPMTKRVRSEAELRDLGELVEAPGQPAYHVVHLPDAYADGTPTGKTIGSELDERCRKLIQERIDVCGGEPPKDHPFDKRARLLGAYIPKLEIGNYDRRSYLNATFADAIIGQLIMINCDARRANFRGAAFLEPAHLNDVTFEDGVTFDDCVFLKAVAFWRSNFKEVASFDSTRFCGTADLIQVTFHGMAYFNGTVFEQDARFMSSRFLSVSHFNGSRFAAWMMFFMAVFAGQAYFQGIKWPDSSMHYSGTFWNTTFSDIANFDASGFRSFSAFAGARFEKGLKFDQPSEAEALKIFNEELIRTQTIDLSKLDPNNAFAIPEDKIPDKAVLRENSLAALEAGCRALRMEVQREGNKTREYLFYGFELTARRKRRTTPAIEKLLSGLYAVISRYGTSQLRPLGFIIGVYFVFAAIYGTFFVVDNTAASAAYRLPGNVVASGHCDVSALRHPSWSFAGSCGREMLSALASVSHETNTGLTVSASRIFPFGPYENVSELMADNLNNEGMPWRSLTFRLVGTIQSLLALTLVFLFGLAVRRRFQIE